MFIDEEELCPLELPDCELPDWALPTAAASRQRAASVLPAAKEGEKVRKIRNGIVWTLPASLLRRAAGVKR
jgi:hypothetical protein